MTIPKNTGNTFSPTLIVEKLAAETLQFAPPLLGPLASFCTTIDADVDAPLRTMELPNVTTVSATQINPSTFESGDGTIAATTIPTRLLSQQFGISNTDAQSGLTTRRLAQANWQTFSKTIIDEAMALLTTGNFGTLTTVASVMFGKSELEQAINAVRTPRRALLLRSDYFAKICPAQFIGGQWSLPGFPGGVHELDFSAAGANVVGAVIDPSAIAFAAGLPVQGVARSLDQRMISIRELEIIVQAAAWLSLSSRSARCSFDCYVGSAVGIAANCKLILSP